MRVLFLLSFLIPLKSFAIGCIGEWPNQICPNFSAAPAETEHDHSEHGFLVLGEQQLHLYHLAKFRSPHRYQAFVEVRLEDSSGRKLEIEKIRNELAGTKILSLLSKEPSSLPDLITIGRAFSADLYAGYLRDREGRKLIAASIRVNVVAVPYLEEIKEQAEGPNPLYRFISVCDTKSHRIYGAHVVQGLNNFEQIFEIGTIDQVGASSKFVAPPVDIGCLGQGVQLELSPKLSDTALPLKTNSSFPGHYRPANQQSPPFNLIFGLVNELVTDLRAVNP